MQAKLRVSRPGDALERAADAVASRVTTATAPASPATGTAPAPRVMRHAPTSIRGPPATGTATPTTTVSPEVESAIAASRGGLPIDSLLRARIEPHVGADLGSVRIRAGPDANVAAAALGARAFASGGAIYLAAGESPRDLALIAHEAAHVAQQQALPAARAQVLRQAEGDGLGDGDSIRDWLLDQIGGTVRAIPGYETLSAIAGQDLLTGRPSLISREQLIEKLLSYGPFGAAVGPVLTTIGVLDEVFVFITEGLTANNLTLGRLRRDLAAAWEEVGFTNSLATNLAIVRRYVDALLRDVRAFVVGIAERIIAAVRAAIASVASPLLETPQIKPLWDLARKVMRYDPLLGRPVQATTVEILGDFLRLIGKEAALEQMTQRGTLQQTADWIDTQLETFAALVNDLGTLFSDAWAAIQPANLPRILETLPQLAGRAFSLIGRVASFAGTVVDKVLELIKRSLLGWLSEYAHRIPGFHLVTVIIERNPFTGENVPRTAENLIKGFITLMPGGEATYEQLAESGVVAEAATRIETAMTELGISWEMVTSTFRGVWDSLKLEDLLEPLAAFARITDRFGAPISRLFEFIAVVVETVVSLVLRLMNFPSDLLASIVANVQRAVADIQRDPVAFILNMLEALKAGFLGFIDHIGTYLLQGLAAWLFRGLGQLGITIPSDFTLPSILQLVLQVLGLGIETLWTKLGQQIGPERVAMIRGAIDHLSGAWSFIQDVQQRGLVAIWELVTDQLSGLWDTLLQMAQDWIQTTIVDNVVARLISMLDPTGVMAVVNSFIAFFRAVQSVIEYVREILQIVDKYVSTVAQIAAGNVQPGAEMVEAGLAAAIPVAIGFLANQVGIGDIPEKIVEIIKRLRALVDKALDWLIAQAIRLGGAALEALTGPRGDPGTQQRTPETAPGSVRDQARAMLEARLPTAQTEEDGRRIAAEVLTELRPHGLRRLEITGQHADGSYIFAAEASAFDELISYLFGQERSAQGAIITRMPTRIVLRGAAEPFPAFPAVPGTSTPMRRPGQPATTTIISTAEERFGRPLSQPTYGGFLPRPDPAAAGATQREVFTGTYNTSDDALACNNRTHAEVQFLRWLSVQSDEFRSRITRIEVEINYSPCSNCTSTLVQVRGLVPASAQCTLTYHTLYTRTRCRTTRESLAAITGWTVSQA